MKKGVPALITGLVAVSTAAVLFRLAEAPALPAAFWRLTFATAMLAPWRWREVVQAVRDPRVLGLQAVVGLVLAVHFATWFESLHRTSVAASLVLVTFHPVLVAVAGAIWLNERPGGRGIAGIGLALVGVVILAGGRGPDQFAGTALSGNLLAFAGAVAMAAYLLAGRHARRRLSTLAWVVPVYGFAAVFLGIGTVANGDAVTGYSLEQWAYFLALAAVPMVLGHTMFNLALGDLPAWTVSTGILAEPPGGTALAVVVLGEVPTVNQVVGGTITLVGLYMVLRRRAAKASTATSPESQGNG